MSVGNTPETANTPAPAPAAAPRPARVSLLPAAALMVALLTAAYVLYRDPPWGRLSGYNFSTPEQALRSDMRMRANGDIAALIELERKMDHKEDKEQLATLDVKRTAEFEGKTALFVQYKVTDRDSKEPKEQKEVLWFERQESGYWRRTASPLALQKGDPQLAKDVAAWTGRPGFQLPPGFGE